MGERMSEAARRIEVGDFETGPEKDPSRKVEQQPKLKFGQDVQVEVEFMRHEEPGKTPEGMSADYLTETGKVRAAAKGKDIDRLTKGYSSPKLRAQETIDLQLQNADHEVLIINQKLSDQASKGEKTIKDIAVGQKPENVFNMRLRPELDTVVNFAAINEETKQWAKAQIANGSKRPEYDLVVQYYLDHPERSYEMEVTTPQDAAEEIAFAASREIGMSKHLYSDSNVKLLNGTHGPKLEPFLQQILIGKDGKRGFASLEEIGGAFKPGENFKLLAKTKMGEKGKLEMEVRLLLRGQEYAVDMPRLEQLARNYRNRLKFEKTASQHNLEDAREEKRRTPKLIKALDALQPTGDLLKDLDILYKSRYGEYSGIADVFTDEITSARKLNYKDVDTVYAHYFTPENMKLRQKEPHNDLARAFRDALEKILASYEAKIGHK